MKRNLLILRAGDRSLHEKWLLGTRINFDLVVLYYGNKTDLPWSEQLIAIKGSKWEGLSQYLSTNQQWQAYDYIGLPDDDLLCTGDDWSDFFDIMRQERLQLAQPSLQRGSYYSHKITLQIPFFKLRRTNFVEVMAPCMSRRFLEYALPDFSFSKSGWGMDIYWPQLLKEKFKGESPAIVDAVSVLHTRPVGSAGHGGANSPEADRERFLNSKGATAAETIIATTALTKSGRIVSGLPLQFLSKIALLCNKILQKTPPQKAHPL